MTAIITRLLVFWAIFLACGGAQAAQLWQPGFRTIGSWTEEPEFRLDVNLWYPANKAPRDLNFSPWTIKGALNAKCGEGPFPLLVLSHDSAGTRFSYHDLAAYLAANGFVVAAPTHGRDSMENMDDFFTWQQMLGRITEIRAAIDEVFKIEDLARNIDKTKIGIAGFGAGATTALVMGGAMPDCRPWGEYCKKAGADDVYCSPWAKEKINVMCGNFPLSKSLEDGQIKAIAAVSPAFGMLFGPGSFNDLKIPTLLVGAGRDKFNRVDLHCEPIARIMGEKAHYLEIAGADAGSLMSRCPSLMEREMPELCLTVTLKQRRAILGRLQSALLGFFELYLRNQQISPEKQIPKDEKAQAGG